MSALIEVGDGVWAWPAEDCGADHPNAGVVLDDDGITVVDSLLVPSQARPFAEAVEALGSPVRRLVLTTSHLQAAGGSSVFPRPAVYGTAQISAHLDQPPDLGVLHRLHPARAHELDQDWRTRPVTHVVGEQTALTPSVVVVPVCGDLEENLVVVAPRAGVVFAGGVASFGVTPLAFQADPARWADTLSGLPELGTTVVPGCGPIGGETELIALAAYLYACVDADGDPGAIPPGPWDAWADRANDEVNVERAALLAAGDTRIPPSMLRRVGLG